MNPYFTKRDRYLEKSARAFHRAMWYDKMGRYLEFINYYQDHIELSLDQQKTYLKKLEKESKAMSKRLDKIIKESKR